MNIGPSPLKVSFWNFYGVRIVPLFYEVLTNLSTLPLMNSAVFKFTMTLRKEMKRTTEAQNRSPLSILAEFKTTTHTKNKYM